MGEVILIVDIMGFVGFFFIINLIWNFDLLINFIFLLLFVIFLKIEDVNYCILIEY